MTTEEIEIIVNSSLPSYQKSELLKALFDQKNSDVKICQKGGDLTPDQIAGREPIKENGKYYYLNGDGEKIAAEYYEDNPEKRGDQSDNSDELVPNEVISIGGKMIKVALAESDEEKRIGLSRIKKLPDGYGMLFIYDQPQQGLWFTMADTSVDLDIIFIDEDGEVTSVHPTKAHDPNRVEDTENNAQFVLETNYGSGIKEGDSVDGDDSLSDDEKESIKQSKMLVLDENGDVQFRLEGGERIFSRISTKKFIKAAIKAYRSDKDSDYKKVGKLVFKELNAQDGREPEYVEK